MTMLMSWLLNMVAGYVGYRCLRGHQEWGPAMAAWAWFSALMAFCHVVVAVTQWLRGVN